MVQHSLHQPLPDGEPPPWIGGAALRRLLPPAVVVDAVESALKRADAPAGASHALACDVAGGSFHVKEAACWRCSIRQRSRPCALAPRPAAEANERMGHERYHGRFGAGEDGQLTREDRATGHRHRDDTGRQSGCTRRGYDTTSSGSLVARHRVGPTPAGGVWIADLAVANRSAAVGARADRALRLPLVAW